MKLIVWTITADAYIQCLQIRDVIDTLREFDLRRMGSSKVYKTRMETELQPHLVRQAFLNFNTWP